jgi:hypothetical protein
MLIYIFNEPALTNNLKYNEGAAEREIQGATTMQELQGDLRGAVVALGHYRDAKNELLSIFFVETVGMIGFLAWSLFMIGRLKKEAHFEF